HGLFTGEASRVLAQAPLERLFVADTVPPFRLDAEFLQKRVAVISTASLVGEMIQRLHSGRSPN
ncbi:MAG TPA: ribose-phosphate pyrophosphokinase, partial [Nitrococcus sp.]|nr:ribose-phosphate pyrophosphokinase [Nitrococcus sp.]